MLINNSSLFWVVANLNLWGNLHMQCSDKKWVSSRTNTVRERQKLSHQKQQHCLQGESIYPEQRGQKARGAVSWSIARVYQEATASSSYSPYFSVYPYNELYERSQLEWFWFSPLAAVWLTQWYSHCLKGDQISESRGKIDVEINKYTSVCQFQDRSMLGVQQSLGDYL